MRVDAERLLLVGPGDVHGLVPAEDLLAVAGVVLERLPSLAVVHALVDGQVLGLAGHVGHAHPAAEAQGGGGVESAAEVDGDVRELELLSERHRQGDVFSGSQLPRLPAGLVVRVVQICQEVRQAIVSAAVAFAFVAADLASLGLGLHADSESGVHKVRKARDGLLGLVVVARVDLRQGRRGRRQRRRQVGGRRRGQAQQRQQHCLLLRHCGWHVCVCDMCLWLSRLTDETGKQ